MGVKGRRTYDDQFKADAVRLGTESNKTVREVAQSLGIEPGTLHTWIRQSGKRSGDAAPAQRRQIACRFAVSRCVTSPARFPTTARPPGPFCYFQSQAGPHPP